mgnify:CR=1 FL=1
MPNMFSDSHCQYFSLMQSSYTPPWSRDRTLESVVYKSTNNGNNHSLSKKQSFALAIKRGAQGTLKTRKLCNNTA